MAPNYAIATRFGTEAQKKTFYTSNVAERNTLIGLGWNDEGIGWIAPSISNTPVYRLYNENAGEHHYTMSIGERDALVEAGWKYEGIGWYSDDAQTVPLYRQYKGVLGTSPENQPSPVSTQPAIVRTAAS